MNFLVLMENYDRSKELAEESMNSSGTADRKYGAYLDSLEASVNGLTNAWEEFTLKLQANPLINFGTKVLTVIIENLDRILTIMSALGGLQIWKNFNKIGNFFGGSVKGAGSQLAKSSLFWDPNKVKGKTPTQESDPITSAIEDGTNKQLSQLELINTSLKQMIGPNNLNGPSGFRGAVFNPNAGEGGTWYQKNNVNDPRAQKANNANILNLLKNSPQDLAIQEGENLRYLNEQEISHWIQKLTTTIEKQTTETEEQTQATKDNSTAVKDNTSKKGQQSEQLGEGEGGTKPSKLAEYGRGVVNRLKSPATYAMGAAAGITAGLTQSETTRTLDSGATVSVESGNLDKAIKGGVVGASTAIGTAVGGPIGGMIGSFLGPMLGDFFLEKLNGDELDRKQRVQEATEQLEVLQSIDSSFANLSTILSNELWDAEDYANASDYLQALENSLREDASIMNDFLSKMGIILEDNLSWDEIENILLNGTQDDKTEISNAIELALLQQEKEATVASQEQIRYEAQEAGTDSVKLYSGWFESFSNAQLEYLKNNEYTTSNTKSDGYAVVNFEGNTLAEKYENAEAFRDSLIEANEDGIYDISIAKVEEYMEAVEQGISDIEAADKAITALNASMAYTASGVSDLTQEALADLSYEGVVNKIAESMEGARNEAGLLTDEARAAIELLINSDSTMTALVRGATYSVSDLIEKQQEFNNALEGTNYSWSELRTLLDYNDLDKFGEIAEELGMTTEALSSLVYAADPTNFQDLAYALNLTTEQLIAMQDVLGDLTFADTLLSSSEVRDKYEDYYSIYEDIASGATLTQENLEMIISKYPELLKYMDDVSALEEELASKIFGEDSEYTNLYENALFESLKNSSALFDDFKENNEALIDKFGDDLREAFEDADTFEQIWQSLMLSDEMAEGSEIAEDIMEALKEAFVDVEYEIDKSRIESVMEYQQHMLDEQIDNLTEQKEALTAINEQRQKELDLIKAQQALENAQDEKVRVYREGIGWTYETNQQAVSDARSTLEDLELQKEQENLELEIERLNLAKEILDDIVSTEEIEGLKTIYESWTSEIEGYAEGQVSILAAIAGAYNTIQETDFETAIENSGFSNAEKQEYYLEAAESQYNVVAEALKAIENTTATVGSDEYNALVQTFQEEQSKLNSYVESSGIGGNEEFGSYMTTAKNEDGTGGGGLSEDSYNSSLLTTSGGSDTKAMTFSGVYGVGSNKTEERDISVSTTYDQVDASVQQKQFPAGNNYYRKISSSGELDSNWSYSEKGTLEDMPDGSLVGNTDGGYNYYLYKKNGNYYYINTNGSRGQGRWATGTESLPEQYGSNMNLINELGTEAIVTPSGTLTALPSKTGIVPADITRNLWQLGEISPSLIAGLDSLNNIPELSNLSGGSVHNDGTFIDSLNMQVYPTKDYDMDKFITEVKQKARISKHTR